MRALIILYLSIFSIACNSQEERPQVSEQDNSTELAENSQIAQYVVSTYEDSKGNLWFGTLEKGIARYDGSELVYFTDQDGFPTNRIIGVIEDDEGNYWFSTGMGLTKSDGKTLTNFTVGPDFESNNVGGITIDRNGEFWIGTWNGVYKFDGKDFESFAIPFPEVSTPINKDTEKWITVISEDNEGNMWFARDGYGASKFDGKAFTHFLKKDGLHSNNVTEIQFDKNGEIWFGTRINEKDHPDPRKRIGKGGVNLLRNDSIISFPEIEALSQTDVYEIYIDKSGNIWICTTSNGVYKYDGKNFVNYEIPISVMSITQDKNGIMWLGGAGGLYKITASGDIVNVTVDGPWE